jgi:hypothetical protein
MKIFTTLFLSLLIQIGYSQSDCKPYVPVSKGAKWEITNYSGKGKQSGKTAFELLDKVETDNQSTFTIKSVSYDKKGKEVFANTYEAYCKNGKFELSMALKMDGASMQAYKDMDVDMDASELEIPSMDDEVGTDLNDGLLSIAVGTGGTPIMTMKIALTDRKIEAKEDLTTPAGTFKCLVVSQKMSTKMIMKIENTSKEWYAEEIGMVRSESYNKGGKLTGYSELTKFEK